MPDTIVNKSRNWRRILKITVVVLAGLFVLPIIVGMVIALLDPETWKAKPPVAASVRATPQTPPAPAVVPAKPTVIMAVDDSLLPILNTSATIPRGMGAVDGLHGAAIKVAELIHRMNRGAYPSATHINVSIGPGVDSPYLAHTTLKVMEAKQYIHIGGSPDGLFSIVDETGFYDAANERAVRPYCTAHLDAARFCAGI